jgi:serine/threonine-protein kinase
MATVYLARDLRHERRVALKVLHPELAQVLGPERFTREIRLAARLDHPHILPVYESGDAGGRLWFTMPFVDGESLRQRLTREPQLPLAETLRITREVAAALGYAHRQGIIHRDVKPENILLRGDRCVLADFGVARAVDAAGERLTETGFALGTPAYMSPEQAAADRHLDHRSDLYSLGCVVYEMLAGEPPFTGRTAQAVIARRMTDPVPALRTVRDVPAEVEQAVKQALARSPADRFADAPAFARALEAAAGHPSAVGNSGARRHLPAAAVALLIALAAAGAWLRARPVEEDAPDSDLLAIAPFEVLDPSLEVWREGMGDVLSRMLDGAGPIRTVSPSVAYRGWSGRADRASAEDLARRTGAGLVVYGAVVPHGRDSATIRATLLDGRGAKGRTDIEVSGAAARIDELTDSLGIQMLRALSSGRAIGSVRRTSIGAKSLPALKAFLQGEQFYRRGLWDSALTRYDQAIAADSTFALALAHMALVLNWHPPTAGAYRPSAEYARRSTLHNHGLSPRDSLLIIADSLNFAAEELTEPGAYVAMKFRALSAVEEATRRYPQDPTPWYVLGEWRMHDLPPIGGRPAASLEAFTRASALDPGFAPPYEHMPGLFLALGHPEEARRSAMTYLALDSTSPNQAETRLAALLLDPSGAGMAEAHRMLDTASVFAVWGAVFNQQLAAWPDTAETAIRLLRRLGESSRGAGGSAPWVLDSVMWPQYLAQVLAFRGHLREAFAANERLLGRPSASEWSGFLNPLVDLSLLGVVPDSLARATFDPAFERPGDWGGIATPLHLRGLPWWLSRGDTAALARFAKAARAARILADPHTALRVRLLGETSVAFLDLARGDSAAAVRKLGAIPDTLCLGDDFADNCFHLNLTLARVLAARGDDARAAALLDRWRWTVPGTPMFVLTTLELGRIVERQGDKRKAAECFDFVMAAWRRPDPELLPYVAEAREGLARLGVD